VRTWLKHDVIFVDYPAQLTFTFTFTATAGTAALKISRKHIDTSAIILAWSRVAW
jgi:hypothetical protein